MRVFLPHAQSNNKLSSSVTNSPREDKRKPEKDEDTTEVAAKKFRVQQQQPEAQLKDPMGGGGKLYPVRKERELLEVKRGNEDHRNSESTNSSDVVAADNNNEENEGVFDGNAAVMQPSPRDEIGDMAARQNHCNSKLQAVTDRAPANLKSEWEEDPGFEDDNNTISLATWDASSACSSFAASKKSNFESKDRNLHPRTAAAAAAASSLAVKSIEDDYDNDPATISKTDITEDELTQYAQLLRTSHAPSLEITPMAGDGNCLFRAISLQVYGSSDMHSTVRTQCLDFMEVEESHFKDFVAEPYDEYIARKRMDGVHGNHAELQAASELYNRRIEVYVPPKVEPMNIFQQEEAKASSGGGEESTAAVNHPIRLLYMDGNHYDALIDPLVPTAGLGLGLPGLQPGLADRLQLDQAKRESNQIIQSNMERKMQLAIEESKRAQAQKEGEEFERVLRESCVGVVGGRADNEEVEDAFVKKSMYLSELDAADFDSEQAVLASSLESYRNAEQERKPAGRRVDSSGRRGRYNCSPRSSSNSPVYHRAAAAASATAINNYSDGFSASPSYNTSSYPARSAAAASYASAAAASSVASFPRARSSSPVNQSPSAHAVAAASINASSDEYPASVQELVMNGFQLSKVLHAYDLIGDNFDDLLSFLLSSTT